MKKIYTLISWVACSFFAIGAKAETRVVTFDPAEVAGESVLGVQKVEHQGVTLSTTMGVFGTEAYSACYYRFSKDAIGQIAVASGKIKKVVFTCPDESAKKSAGADHLSIGIGDYQVEGLVGTWTGEAQKIALDFSKGRMWCTQIEVTIDDDGSGGATEPDDGRYPINFDKDDESTCKHNRFLASFALGEQAKQVAEGVGKIYCDLTSYTFTGVAGEVVNPVAHFSGEWMNAYVYIDFNNDGQFEVKLNSLGIPEATSELVSYSFYDQNGDGEKEGTNSEGETLYNDQRNTVKLPPFTLPANLKPGKYRMRVKIDWNNIDPAGHVGETNDIRDNGGQIADFTLEIKKGEEHAALSLSELIKNTELKNSVQVQLNNAKVIYVSPNWMGGTDLFVAEGESAIRLFSADIAAEVNDVLNGEINCTYSYTNEMPALSENTVTDWSSVAVTKSGEAAEPIDATIEDITNDKKYRCNLVRFKDVKVFVINARHYYLGKDEGTLKVEDDDIALYPYEGKTCTVVGVFYDIEYGNPLIKIIPQGITVGIDEVLTEKGATVVYDLQGRQVNAPQKGKVYIINGAKVLH